LRGGDLPLQRRRPPKGGRFLLGAASVIDGAAMAVPAIIAALPEINAGFNTLSAALLLGGRVAIARGRRDAHRMLMLSAFAASALFLAGYLTRAFTTGTVRFEGPAPWRTVYLSILVPHMILAVTVVPLVLASIWLAHKEQFAAHRRLVRWTFPIWLFVSVTGVIVYAMLYHFPA
jgi:putative membrane protein